MQQHVTQLSDFGGLGNRDDARVALIIESLKEANLDAFVCGLPTNVLALCGYWPVVGNSIAIATKEAKVVVVAPADEKELAQQSWAQDIFLYSPPAANSGLSVLDVIQQRISDATRSLHIQRGRIGYDGGYQAEPSTYAAEHVFGVSIANMLRQLFPSAAINPAEGALLRLKSRLTSREIDCLRLACRIAAQAFSYGKKCLAVGLKETEAAWQFARELSVAGTGFDGVVQRADGFMYCMSGANSAQAFGAYARSRAKAIQPGEPILIHCNSYADGYWTDITRTYHLGEPSAEMRNIHQAVLAARQAALRTITCGIKAEEVDAAVRKVLDDAGYGKYFKHPTGHGVGFAAFDPGALPRLRSGSPDVLQVGSVFNVEPAIYIEGVGGVRHCDVVHLGANGSELLTDFDTELSQLIEAGPA